MAARVACLARYHEKGGPGEALSEATLLEGLGMEGNRHQGGERQLSLLLVQARHWMAGQAEPGLCFGRFKENLLIDGLDPGDLAVGTRLSVGDAVLRVSADAKHCFPECALLSSGAPCRLPGCAAFAVVERSGVVRVGGPVSAIRLLP